MAIEEHYGRPMDIEWGKDGTDGELYILQARPETVKSHAARPGTQQRYGSSGARPVLSDRPRHRPEDRAGTVRVVHDASARWTVVQAGDVLVTDMTDPNWEPVMKRARRS